MTTTWALPARRGGTRPDTGRVFAATLGFIAAVSVYDTFLTYQVRDVIANTERNPICLWLIQTEPTHLGLFIPCKLLGTAFVVGVCGLMYRQSRRHALAVAGGVATFQSWLLCYLQL